MSSVFEHYRTVLVDTIDSFITVFKFGSLVSINYALTDSRHVLYSSIVAAATSGDFCCFKLALPSLLFMSKDEVKAAHSEIDCCHMEDGGGLHPKNPPDQHFSQPHFIVVTVFSFLELRD